jgi:hypothetical protein
MGGMAVIERVISGGQTGCDQAALRAARARGLAIGGWCPPGRQCEGGTIPSAFPLVETPEERSPAAPDVPRSQRTEWNVRDSDGTLILTPESSARDPGTEWTEQCALRLGRPLLVCDPANEESEERIRAWLCAHGIRVLNVAGPSETTSPGIGELVSGLLGRVLAGTG